MGPFQHPDEWAARVADGSVCRVGSALRDAKTGEILAYVQETERFSTLADPDWGGYVLEVGRVLQNVLSNVPLEKVKAVLAGLKMLNPTALAVIAVGAGVAAAGFVYVARRLGRLEQELEKVGRDVLATRL